MSIKTIETARIKSVEAALETRLREGKDMISVRAVIDALYILADNGDSIRAVACMTEAANGYVADADVSPAARVLFTTEDVAERFDGSEAEADEWLSTNANRIENRLAELGNEVIETLLSMDGKLAPYGED